MLSVVCIQGSSEEIFPRTRLAWSPVALIQIRGWIALSYPVHGTCARRGDLSACKSRSRKIVAWHRICLVQHQHGVFNIEIHERFNLSGRYPRAKFAPSSAAGHAGAAHVGLRRKAAHGTHSRRAGPAQRVWFHDRAAAGKDWTVAEYAYDSVVYVRSSDSEGRERGGKSFAQASLGVVALPAGGTVSADESGFAKAALNFLSDRFRGQPRVKLLDLKTVPYSLHGALCAGFEAVQAERRTTRQNNGGHLEFLNRGFLCRHPDNRTVVVHGFFNKINRRVAPRLRGEETEREANRFLESVIFSPLH